MMQNQQKAKTDAWFYGVKTQIEDEAAQITPEYLTRLALESF
jgi:hypothetical protein